jgi:hypothetical protein
MNRSGRHSLFLGIITLLATAGAVHAQESRGSISGRVTDASGAILVGAKVMVVNQATNATMSLTTNAAGQYSALYLLPGTYSVTVEREGFTKTVNESVEVRVGDKIALDFTLSPKGVTETIDVVSTRPLLDEGTGTSGQVVESGLITELPLGDGTALSLIRVAQGVYFTGGYALQRPMDNANLSAINIGGAWNSEYNIDGSSNVVAGRRMGVSPPMDAIQEFKVATAVYDAQMGHTGGGQVDLALKSGANTLHGAAYYFNRDDSRAANDFQSNRIGMDRPARDYYRAGGMLSGPIVKNKTFFMITGEKLEDNQVEPVTLTVPTQAMRNGDFSALLAQGIQIYDPYTARQEGNRVVRDPFPGNIIPAERINPVATAVLSYYPLPNFTSTAADGITGNYSYQQPWTYNYNLQLIRIDHHWSANHRSYVRAVRNWRNEERYDWAGQQNGYWVAKQKVLRWNQGLAFGHTALLSPSAVLDVKASLLRFGMDEREPYEEFDPSTLGFSQQDLALFGGFQNLPRFEIQNFQSIGGMDIQIQPFYNINFGPTLTKTTGAHTIKLGYDLRILRENHIRTRYKAGQYIFNGDYTRETSTSPSQIGQGMAAFLLGQPTSGNFEPYPSNDRADEVVQHGVFVQDDWRVSPKLTLNLGLRYDVELGMTERYYRNTAGFDFTSPSPIEADAKDAYAANPIPEVPADQFAVRGGYTFLSDSNPHVWDADTNNIQPRFGFSYKLDEKTIMRGGLGLFVAPYNIDLVNQLGYSRSTPMYVTDDQGLTFQADINPNTSNPALTGGFLPIVGSSQGLATNMGNNAGTVRPQERPNAQYWRTSFGIQRRLPGDLVFEIQYLGAFGQNLGRTLNHNDPQQQYRSTSTFRDNAVESYMSAKVPNPFQGLLPDSPGNNGATISRSRLLQEYPQFGSVNEEKYDGSSRYHALALRLEKRFTKGFSFIANYTYSKLREKVTPLNPWEDLEDRVGGQDRPHRLVLATVAQFPFGKGRKWGGDWNPALEAILGGWTFSANYQFQSGTPLGWVNVYWDSACGDPKEVLKSAWGHDANGQKYGIDVPIIDTACFYTQNGAPFVDKNGNVVTYQASEIAVTGNNVRTFPSLLPNVRGQDNHSLDLGLSKTFQFGDGVKLQVRADAINALTYTIFRDARMRMDPRRADFGLNYDPGSSVVVIRGRDIQLGARLTF